MAQLRIYVLGPFVVTRDDTPVTGFESDKMRALLAYLVLEADRPQRREALAALLWPEQPETAARQGLRQALYILRQILNGPRQADSRNGDGGGAPDGRDPDDSTEALLVDRQTVQFQGLGETWCDAWLFRRLLAACQAHSRTQAGHTARCGECLERLRQATALYRGDFLQGFLIADSRAFEEWLLLERESYHRQMLGALGALADYHEEVGEHEQALHFALWQLQLEPWREEAHRQAMRLFSRTGQRSAALAQYAACRETLAAELGLAPARETTALYERIRDATGEPPLERPLPGQALLPLATTPLIGREAEVTAVVEYLLRPEVRLLTLTGPGGTGKTRIAWQAAADLHRYFADGAYLVNLAPIRDPRLVAGAIATALGVQERPDQPALARLVAALHDKAVLLLLDNFEQVAAAAPLVGQLIAATRGVKALVTSRATLRLRGTAEFPVPPMALPDRAHLPALERLTGYEGIRLFVARAAAIQPGFALTAENAAAIVEICHRLDGLPLAIELAAARIRVLPPSALLERLQGRLDLLAGKDQDVPARQQTLRQTIDWSYHLLDPAEKALFRRMAAFQGGRTLTAIETVCALPDLPGDLLDGVEGLISKSLLQRLADPAEEPRFGMLETIHEYAREKLRESGEEDAIRHQHARYFLELAEKVAPHLKQHDQACWLEEMDAEYDNIRAALHWARVRGGAGDDAAAALGLRLAIALQRFWSVRVYLREGVEQTLGVLALGRPGGALRAGALIVAADLAQVCGDYATAQGLLEESVGLWRALGDKPRLGAALHALGNVRYVQMDYRAARGLYQESLRIEQELELPENSWHNLGLVDYELGDYESARAILEIDLRRQRASGDARLVAITLANLGLVACAQGDYGLASARHLEGLAIRQKLGAKLGIVYSLEGLAEVYRGLGRAVQAARLWGLSAALRVALGVPLSPNDQAHNTQQMDRLRDELGQAAFDQAYAKGQTLSSEQVVAGLLAEAPVQTRLADGLGE